MISRKIRNNVEIYYYTTPGHCVVYNPDGPSYIEKYPSGAIKLIKRTNSRGELHHDHEPALITMDEDGCIISKIYYSNGVKHNTIEFSEEYSNGHLNSTRTRFIHGVPSERIIQTQDYVMHESYNNGICKRVWYYGLVIIKIEYFKNGVLHRSNDKPAVIDVSNREKQWYKRGKLHRKVGPAVVIDLGNIFKSSEWYIDGKKHRIGNYAVITDTRRMDTKEYYVDGELHNSTGPACVDWHIGMEVYIEEKYFFMGTEFKNEVKFQKYVGDLRRTINELPMPIADEIIEQLF